MPVPRLFEAFSDPHEQWAHVLACLLGLTGPETAAALVSDLVGEELPLGGPAQVREQRIVAGGSGPVDIVVRDGSRLAVAVQATLAFDHDEADRVREAARAVAGSAERTIVLAITPDRTPPAWLAPIAEGDVRHRSWLRVRDWVQERPERGRAQGVDAALLREAEYFLTPRVAELYRLEGVMPLLESPSRPALAAAFFELNDVSPAPRMEMGDPVRITFPRTGDAPVELVVTGRGLTLAVNAAALPDAVAGREGWSSVRLGSHADWLRARSPAMLAARTLLPARL